MTSSLLVIVLKTFFAEKSEVRIKFSFFYTGKYMWIIILGIVFTAVFPKPYKLPINKISYKRIAAFTWWQINDVLAEDGPVFAFQPFGPVIS